MYTNLQRHLEFHELQYMKTEDLQLYTDGSVSCRHAGYGALLTLARLKRIMMYRGGL